MRNILCVITFLWCFSLSAFHVTGSLGPTSSILPRIEKRFQVATSWFFFKWNGTQGYDFSKIDEARVTKTAKEWPAHVVLIIDIENFKNDDYGNSQLEKTIDILRRVNPSIRLGVYGEFPQQQYWERVPHKKNEQALASGKEPTSPFLSKKRYDNAWSNDMRRSHLARKVDIIFPSCYTFYRNQAVPVQSDSLVRDWELYCEDQVQSAKRYGKEIYVFLWPLYHPNSGANPTNKLVEGQYWRRQLDLVYKIADGIVIWEGDLLPAHMNGEWWSETTKFLNEKQLYVANTVP